MRSGILTYADLKPTLQRLVTLPTPISIVATEIGVSRAESTSATWEEVFHTKLNVLTTWLRGIKAMGGKILHIEAPDQQVNIAPELRGHIEMRGLKELGGKILHIEAADQQANVAPELRGHRSETELDSPEVLTLRDAYLYNDKSGIDKLVGKGLFVLDTWGWR